MNPNAIDKDAETEPVGVRDLSPGDRVIWGVRRVPLTVQDSDVSLTGTASREVVEVKNEEQDDGATYFIVEKFTTMLDPKVKKRVPISPQYPEGVEPHGYADDLRRVVED